MHATEERTLALCMRGASDVSAQVRAAVALHIADATCGVWLLRLLLLLLLARVRLLLLCSLLHAACVTAWTSVVRCCCDLGRLLLPAH